MDPDVPGLALRRRLLADGYRDEELRRMRLQRRIVPIRPGAYVPADDTRLRDPVARHRLAVQAAARQVAPGSVVSHASAAVMHGLPLWATPLGRVHLTRNRRSGGRRSRFLHLHAAALEADEIVMVGGFPVTSVARTIVDLARAIPFEPALVPADAALFRKLVRSEDLLAAVERSSNRRGNTAARRVVGFAHKGGESVGETRSRVAMHRANLPAPVLQQPTWSRAGSWLGRVDFDWPQASTIGEFDGEVKYGRLLGPGQSPGDVVFAEKVREDALRDNGLRVVRWVWADLDAFDVVAERLRRAFGAP